MPFNHQTVRDRLVPLIDKKIDVGPIMSFVPSISLWISNPWPILREGSSVIDEDNLNPARDLETNLNGANPETAFLRITCARKITISEKDAVILNPIKIKRSREKPWSFSTWSLESYRQCREDSFSWTCTCCWLSAVKRINESALWWNTEWRTYYRNMRSLGGISALSSLASTSTSCNLHQPWGRTLVHTYIIWLWLPKHPAIDEARRFDAEKSQINLRLTTILGVKDSEKALIIYNL